MGNARGGSATRKGAKRDDKATARCRARGHSSHLSGEEVIGHFPWPEKEWRRSTRTNEEGEE